MLKFDYLTDTKGKTKAVVIPIEIWDRLFIDDESSVEDMTESMGNYALGRSMDEAENSPALNREDALAFLEV